MDPLTKSLIEQDRRMQRAIFWGKPTKKKRAKLTPSQRLYVWEHPNLYGRKCSICGQRIIKQSDMELDHTHPHSSGGTRMNLAHKECNRMKGSKGLRHIQKKMMFKTSKRKTRSDKGKRKQPTNPFQIKVKEVKIPKNIWNI